MVAIIASTLLLFSIAAVVSIIMDLLGVVDEWIDERIDRRFK